MGFSFGLATRGVRVLGFLLLPDVPTVPMHAMPTPLRLSAFQGHVAHVRWLAAEKQVVGIHAEGIVAAVKDMIVFRDVAAIQTPSAAMRALAKDFRWAMSECAIAAAGIEGCAQP